MSAYSSIDFNSGVLPASVTLKDNFNSEKSNREQNISAIDGIVNAYFCGFTAFHPDKEDAVYMPIEKLRLYVMYDLLIKVLRGSGYKVNHVMNITDIPTSPVQAGENSFATEKEFFALFSALGLENPDKICRASEHISDMVDLLNGLTAKGYTYVYDGNLYFDTAKFRSKDIPLPVAVKDTSFSGKHNPEDFVLWFSNSQKYPNPSAERVYPSPKGISAPGFPGWHIECSVMALKYCGEYLSIHGGSTEHKSAHHASEVLQSEAFTGHKWVDSWFHIASLKFADERREGVSLSLIQDKGYTADELKYFFLHGNYNQRLTFSWRNLQASAEEYAALKAQVSEWSKEKTPVTPKDLRIFSLKLEEFDTAVRKDLDMVTAWKAFKELAKADISSQCKLIFASHIQKMTGLNLLSLAEPKEALNVSTYYAHLSQKIKS